MTSKMIAGLALVLSAANVAAQEGGKIKQSNAHIGLVYPLSTNGTDAINYRNKFSIHAIGGVSASEEGFCASGFGNFIRYNGNGLVAAGFANIIMANADGAQLGGFMNFIKNDAKGLQGAGFANITGSSTGLQAAGFANINTGNVRGAQLGGFMNLAKKVKGFQGAGFVNVAKDADGAQVAGFGNNAVRVKGTQVAGFYNIAGSVNTQVAGFINVAKDVKGVQLSGFINIADSCDYPIGIINISKKGEKFLGATLDDNLTTLVTFRSGGKYLYGIAGVGANFRYATAVYASEAGIGAHIPLAKSFRINMEVVGTSLSDYWSTVQINSSFRVLGALKLGNRFEIFAGPAFHYSFSNDLMYTEKGTNFIWSRDNWGYYQRMYIGGIAGIHFDI